MMIPRFPSIAVATLLTLSTLPAATWTEQALPGTSAKQAAAPLWLRCYVQVPDNMVVAAGKDLFRDSMTLSLAGIDGPFAVYLNGQKIIEGADLPDEPRRRFKVPKDILQKKAFNGLAIQIERGGVPRRPPVLAGYFDEVVMEGAWEAATGEVIPDELAVAVAQPARAFFTDKLFRQSVTPLAANAETMPGIRQTPAEQLAQLKPADDLALDLVLADPVVAQPTHLSFDERGRMWVSQYRQYPYPAGLKQISRDKYYRAVYDRVPPAPPKHDRGRDRITVHEDTNGDGTFDKTTVVLDGLNLANSALRGHGGLWVMHTPYLLFYPDANGDDIPDRDPEVRLAGFGFEDTHSTANGLTWGPDGWLYGTQGSTVTCRVVRPDVDPANATGTYFEGCFVWRYHPQTKAFEIFSEGGGNSFGLEFDAEGRLFCGHNGGETRGWHFVQNGLYLMQGKEPGKFGPPRNPFLFSELPMMKSTNPIQRFSHNLVTLDGTALPSRYTGRLLGTDPLHRNLVVSDRVRTGSTFTTTDTGFALTAESPIFRPVYMTNGPDGSVYVADFCEDYIAHGQHYQSQIDPDSGRIFRLRGKENTLEKDTNLAVKGTEQLLALLGHANKWHRTTAVRLLAERRDAAAIPKLRELLSQPPMHPALEALWVLHQVEALDDATALQALKHPAAPVRAWAVRLMGDRRSWSAPFQTAVLQLATTEPDAEVRAQLASSARMLPSEQALPLIAALLTRGEDATDPFQPLLCWFAIEARSDHELPAIRTALAQSWDAPLARDYVLPRLMRKLAAKGSRADLLACAQLFTAAPTAAQRTALMAGFEEAFKGRALPPLPDELVEALASAGNASLLLRVRRGDAAAQDEALVLIANPKAKPEERLLYVRTLGEVRLARAVPALLALAREDKSIDLRKTALAALQNFDSTDIGTDVAAAYTQFPPDVQTAAQNLLTSRPAWSGALLSLLENGGVKSESVPVDMVARLRRLRDAGLAKRVAALFPEVAPVKSAAQGRIAQIRAILTKSPGNAYAGEASFMARCASCHQLFHKGGKIGPNLTSYQRDDLGTMLTSIVDPNAEVREGFVNYLATAKDGRVLSGFLADQDSHVIVLRGLDGQDLTLARKDLSDLQPAGRSLMPEGLLEGLTDEELRDLFAYLRIPQPISR